MAPLSLPALIVGAIFCTQSAAQLSNRTVFEIAPELHEIARRDNTGCVPVCLDDDDDSMEVWGNWQGCRSSYPPNSGTVVLEEQDEYNHNRHGLIWEHDHCWTNVVST